MNQNQDEVKIVTIVENTSVSKTYKAKHGLCIYIETQQNKILFDTGPNGLLIENAKKLGVDLSEVDTLILSHGHIDHGGGIKAFLSINKTAKVYIQKKAFLPLYIKVLGIPFSVGIDKELQQHPQVCLLDGTHKISDELFVFTGITSQTFDMKSNRSLYKREENKLQRDDFSHEQSLVIKLKSKSLLFSGCSHQGIVDIQKEVEHVVGVPMDYVIGGFHIFNPTTRIYEPQKTIQDMGEILKKNDSKYLTCHCTGKKGYETLKEVLNENIEYLSVGKVCYL